MSNQVEKPKESYFNRFSEFIYTKTEDEFLSLPFRDRDEEFLFSYTVENESNDGGEYNILLSRIATRYVDTDELSVHQPEELFPPEILKTIYKNRVIIPFASPEKIKNLFNKYYELHEEMVMTDLYESRLPNYIIRRLDMYYDALFFIIGEGGHKNIYLYLLKDFLSELGINKF